MPPVMFTDAEIEKMRLAVTEHDKKASANEFDLNNPPRTNYAHQAFPKVLYGRHAEGHQTYKKVNDAEEHAAALKAGWSNEPVAPVEREESPLDAADAAEVAAIDETIVASRKKSRARGR